MTQAVVPPRVAGSLLGFVSAFAGGDAAGRTTAIVYNRVISD